MHGLSLIGAILLSFGVPIGYQGFLSNNQGSQLVAVPLLLIGLGLVLIDLFDKEHWLNPLLGIDE